MPASSPSTTLYALGKGVLSIGEWTGTTPPGSLTDVGNCPRFEVEVTEDRLTHYTSRSDTRLKDKIVTLEVGYTLSFDLDEVSVLNLKMFLKATLQGSNVLLAATALNREYQLQFVTDNPVGPNEEWDFWRCQLSPGGSLNLISDDWQMMSFTGEGLADRSNHATSPYFTVTYATTTTTTT